MENNNLAKRYNEGKLQWSLVNFKALESLVHVLNNGAEKYGKHNWQKGRPFTETCESAMRHLVAFMEGETSDQESGESHLGHVMANMMFLQYYINEGIPGLDDRPIRREREDRPECSLSVEEELVREIEESCKRFNTKEELDKYFYEVLTGGPSLKEHVEVDIDNIEKSDYPFCDLRKKHKYE